MAHQDLKPQVFHFGNQGGGGGSGPKKVTEAQANRARQAGGTVDVSRKMGGGNHHNDLGRAAKRLDDDSESLKHKTVSASLKVNIMKARQAKGWTQKDLATHINEKAAIVTEYESGKAIPNEGVIQRMEKALGVHLRGAKCGQPMAARGPPGATLAKK